MVGLVWEFNKNIVKNLCNEILFEKMMMKSFEMMI